MSSYGHRVYGPTDELPVEFMRNPMRATCNIRMGRTGKRCDEPALFVVEYAYTTGRAGRTTTNRQSRCIEHARKFADTHGCAFPCQDSFHTEELTATVPACPTCGVSMTDDQAAQS